VRRKQPGFDDPRNAVNVGLERLLATRRCRNGEQRFVITAGPAIWRARFTSRTRAVSDAFDDEDADTCPYQKLHPRRDGLDGVLSRSPTRNVQNLEREVRRRCTTETHVDAHRPGHERVGPGKSRPATVRRRDVRSGDANRRRVGLGRSCRRLAVIRKNPIHPTFLAI